MEIRVDESPRRLVELAMRSDSAAFAKLVRRYERTALAIAYAVVGDASLASDVAQDAFLRCWQRLCELDDPDRFGAWLSRIVRNLATDHLRRRRKEISSEDQDQTNDPGQVIDPSSAIDHSDRKSQIDRAIAELDELSRSIVVLKYYEALSSKQIAELLEISPAAVDMRLSRARSELRQKLAVLSDADARV
jgi:RNA polymerase sigma-70 factor (ECF subfamily)